MVDAVETKRIEHEAAAMVRQANEITVANAGEYETAGEFIVAVRAYRKRVGKTFDPVISAAHVAHKTAIAAKKVHDLPALEAENLVNDRMGVWRRDERHRVEKERREAEAKARKEAEAEALARAEAAEAEGRPDVADAILEAPIVPEPVVARPAVPKVAGITVRRPWGWDMVDETKIPRQYLMVDKQKIGQIVRAMKQKAEKMIPGIRVVQRDSTAVGG